VSSPDTQAAQSLLSAIAGSSAITFQTYDDSPRKRGALSKVRHGQYHEHQAELAELNQQGAAVCFMVNRGDGRGRAGRNVIEIRAVFVDLDGVPLEPVLSGPLMPHITVESSPGKHHAYWLSEGIELAEFSALQLRIAAMFGGDRKVTDLPRVMRLPGYFHQKGAAFQTRLLSILDHPRYSREQLAAAFGLELQSTFEKGPRPVTTKDNIPEGERNETLFRLARGLVNKGFPEDQVRDRIQLVNSDRCKPPLCATEVDSLVASACSHPPKGSLNLPLVVFDSDAYRNLSHAGRTVVAMAYRRFNGSNNGNISLPFEDFRKEFSRSQSFYRARNEGVEAGLLRVTRKRRYHVQGGRQPDLFEVAVEPLSVPIQKRSAFN